MSSFEPETPLAPVEGFVPDPLPSRPGLELAAGSRAPEPTLEERIQSAYEEGRRAGRAELPWQEAEALRRALATLEKAAASLQELRRGYLHANRRVTLELALAIAERIVAREVRQDPSVLEALLGRCLERLDPEAPVELRLAPSDLETLQQGESGLLERLAQRLELHCVADPTLAPGDLRLSSGPAEVDARLDTLLSHVREELSQVLGVPEAEDES